MIRRRVVVHGIVQGVFFRASCQQEASRRGVAGWVTNRRDGAVEAVFEGEDAAVDQMVEWMRHGPRSAVIERTDVAEETPEGEFGFSVR
jgi:acylphosphatase